MKTLIAAILASAAGLLGVAAATATGAAPEPPKFLYGHDLKVRPGGERDWKKAVSLGMEVFQDEKSGAVIGITDAGAIAATRPGPLGAERKTVWLTAHDLKVRSAGESDFSRKTRAWGVEVYRDQGSGRLLYVCESRSIAFAPFPADYSADGEPKLRHGLVPKVRKPDQDRFDGADSIGMEVYTDGGTGGLVYVTESGALATAPPPGKDFAFDPSRVAAPKALHGLVLRVRSAAEADFTDDTQRVGVEVFEDRNAGVLFYITDAGFVATAPKPAGPLPEKAPDGKAVEWVSAMTLKARPPGKADFKDATRYGIEVYRDRRTGYQVFLCETGSIAVLPPAEATASASAVPDPTKLVGKWKQKDLPEGVEVSIEFTRDGKTTAIVSINGRPASVEGTYTLEGNKLSMSVKGGRDSTTTILKLTGDELEYEGGSDKAKTIKFVRAK
jgi:uncharacterized protein (TIGR03066 family)